MGSVIVTKRELYVSTGTLVGRSNGYNYRRAMREIAELREKELCTGLELMMLQAYYDQPDQVAEAVLTCGVVPAVIHCEKEVGTVLSDAGKAFAEGENDAGRALTSQAEEWFRLNCAMAERLGIRRMVLHLWGGRTSDRFVAYNISRLSTLNAMARESGVRLLIENVPSTDADPRSNWKRCLPQLGDAGLIFDTRFGQLHEQTGDILTDPELAPLIEHVHISDFGGTCRDFSALRPILHPGEGKVDFPEVSRLLDGMGYRGTVTLESPVMVGEELDIPKLERTLRYLRGLLCE